MIGDNGNVGTFLQKNFLCINSTKKTSWTEMSQTVIGIYLILNSKTT